MGEKALDVPTGQDRKRLPQCLRDDLPPPLKPTAEECFRRALALNPDLVSAREELVKLYLERDKPDRAEKAAREALKRHPEHPWFLEQLSDFCLGKGNASEALEFATRAVRANPLGRELRSKLAYVHLVVAREMTCADRLDEARLHYEAGLAVEPTESEKPSILLRWAACEFKAGNPGRAEELLAQARAAGGTPLALAFGMVVEVGRLKLSAELKQHFEQDFAAGLAAPVDPESVVQAAYYTGMLQGIDKPYPGMKTHDKKVMDYVKKAKKCEFTERQYSTLIAGLEDRDARMLFQHFVRRAQKAFPNSPRFVLAEIGLLCGQADKRHVPVWTLEPLVRKARRLVDAMPREDLSRDEFAKLIEQAEEVLEALNPFGFGFRGSPFDFGSGGWGPEDAGNRF
jgi:tetratricopeptide (TPR) repeat protein